MRAKTKKWFSPLFVLTLAVAGIFGVSAAVVDKQAEETPVVEKADAASSGTRRIFLVDQIGAYSSDAKLYLSTAQKSVSSTTYVFNKLSDTQVNGKTIYYVDAPTATAFHYVVRTDKNNSSTIWNYTETSFTLSNTVNEIFLYGWNGSYMQNSTGNAYPYVYVNNASAAAMTWNPSTEKWTYTATVNNNDQMYIKANMNDLDKYMGFVSAKSGNVGGCTQGDSLVSQDGHTVYKLKASAGKYTFSIGSVNLYTYGDPTYDWGGTSSITSKARISVGFKGVFKKGDNIVKSGVSLTPATESDTYAYYSETYTANASEWTSYDYTDDLGITTTYSFKGWYTAADLGTAFTSKANVTSAFDIYAKFVDEHTYTLTYYKICDGVNQNQKSYQYTGITSGTAFSSITPTLYGYTFDGWFSNATLTSPLTGYVGSDTNAYAKFTRDSSNRTIYFDISNCSSYINGTIYVHYFLTNEISTDWPGIKASSTGITNLYYISLPSDCAYFIINNNDGSGRAQAQTVDIAPDSSKNLFCVNTNNSSAKQNGEWFTAVYKLGGYFDATSSSTGDWTSYNMSPSTSDNGNLAEITGITVTAYTQFKVNMYYVTENTSGVSTVHNYWFGKCEPKAFLNDNWTTHGSETDSTDTSVTPNQHNHSDGYNNGSFKTAGKYSFYFKNNIIYIEDDSSKDEAGFLYFANPASASDIRITAVNSNGATTENNARLSAITDVSSVSNLKFNSITGMHKIPLYNLRGNQTNYYITSLTISDGSSSKTYTWAAATTGSPDIYIDISSTTQDSTTKGPQAAVAFDFAKAIIDAEHSSVCAIEKETAGSLIEKYDNLGGNTSVFLASSVYTWSSTYPTTTGSQEWPMSAILYRVNEIANDGVSRGSLNSINQLTLFTNSEDNTSIILIIIASGISILSITALSVLMVKKKKSANK